MASSALSHYLKVLLGIHRPYTQTTNRERERISKYANQAAVAVEIGVFEGVNTVEIAKAQPPHGKLFGIDPFFKGRAGICYYERIARVNLKRNKVLDKVKLLPVFSHDAVQLVPGEVDFIFIDGDHSYEGVQRDWSDWSGKVKPGGVIGLHDTSIAPDVPGVEYQGSYHYFNETIVNDKRFSLVETVDSLNFLKRNVE